MIYLCLALLVLASLTALFLYGKLLLWKLEHDLVEWLSFGTAMDIFNARAQRPEYKHYVDKTSPDFVHDPNYPARLVIEKIREDLKSKDVFLPIYLKLILLKIKGIKFK
jgi:hypothetical protein